MRLFDGLYPYEIIMLLLGVLLFLVLLCVFVALVIRKQPYVKLFIFFALPIVMIGFPGIKSIEISESMVKIERDIENLKRDPMNIDSRVSLNENLAKVSARPISDPDLSATIARAQIAIGNETAAEARVARILREAPRQPVALELKRQIEFERRLVELTAQVKQNPGNAAAKAELQNAIDEVGQNPLLRLESMDNLSRARKALGIEVPSKSSVYETHETIVPSGPKEKTLNIYSTPEHSVQEVSEGSNCIFIISRGGFSTNSEARENIQDTVFRISVNKSNAVPLGDPTTIYHENGGPWHIEQRFKISNVKAGTYSIIGTTYSRRMGELDSRSFTLRCI
ncbi:MAG: tetratricopeptide repeat protein [Acidobacteria bacterium]|nr:tetratricopeptide repeat protein [Acidobacteriota bacterium]